MQNLLWKFVVLTGVIGASCGVVYQAHKEISLAQSKANASPEVELAGPHEPATPPGDAPRAETPLAGQLDDWHSLLSSSEGAEPTSSASEEAAPKSEAAGESLFAGGWPPASSPQRSAAAPAKFPVTAGDTSAARGEALSFDGAFAALPSRENAPAQSESEASEQTIHDFPGAATTEVATRPAPIEKSAIPWGASPAESLTPLPEGHPGPVLMSPPEEGLRQAVAALSETEKPKVRQAEASVATPSPVLPLFGPPVQDEPEVATEVNHASNSIAGDPFGPADRVVPAAGQEEPTPTLISADSEEVVPFMAPPAGGINRERTAQAAPATEPRPFEGAATQAVPVFGAEDVAPAANLGGARESASPWPAIQPRETPAPAAVDPFSGAAQAREAVTPEPSPFQFPPRKPAAEPEPKPAAVGMPEPNSASTIPQRQPGFGNEEVTPEPVLAIPFSAPPVRPEPASAPTPMPTLEPAADPTPAHAPVVETPAAAMEPHRIAEPLNVMEPAKPITGTGTVPADAPRGPQQPELKIEKIAPTEATLGEPLIYSIVVRNIGGSPAHKVVVEDRIPKGVDAQDVGTSPQAFVTGDKLFWELGTLLPGNERKIQLRVIPIEAGDIGSVATVSFATSVAASIRVTAPKLSLSIDGPGEAAIGEQVSYRFRVSNSGEGEARKVFLRMLLPAGVQHPGGNDLEYEVGSLPPGQSRDVELNLMAIASGLIHPEALVTIDGNVKDKQQVDLNVIEARLTLERTGPTRRFIGRPAVYHNVVTNVSAESLTNITVSEQIPPGVEWKAQAGLQANWDPKTRTATWTIPQLQPGESQQLSSQIVAEQVGDHAGNLTAHDARGNRADLATSLAVKGFADLGIDVTRPGQPVLVGEQVSMRVSIRNDGTASARHVQAAFEIPKGLNFVSAKGPVAYNPVGSMVAFSPIDEIAVGQKQDFDIVLTAAEVNADARVKVHLDTADLETPIQREELIRISE